MPVTEEVEPAETDEIDYGGQGPGKRVYPVDQTDIMEDLSDGEQEKYTHSTPADEHDQHGNHWFSESAHDCGGCM